MKRYLIGLITLLLIVGCGKKDGLHTEYFDDAKKLKRTEGNYKDGEKDGVWTFFKRDGEKYIEGAFWGVDSQGDPIKDGVWTYYPFNGKLHAEHTYKDGEKDGKWTDWHENGQKASDQTYKNGKPDGLWTNWYENGQKQSEGTVKEGKKVLWDEDEQVKGMEFSIIPRERTFFVPKDGKWTAWWDNGQKQSEGTYKHNLKYGKWTYWHKNGQKNKEGNYSIGRARINPSRVKGSNYLAEAEVGFWTEWYENGQKEEERERNDNGQLIRLKCWDEDGNETECSSLLKWKFRGDLNEIIDSVNLPELIEQASKNPYLIELPFKIK